MNEDHSADLIMLRSTEHNANDRFAALRRLIASPAMTAAEKESLACEMLTDPDPQIVVIASLALSMPGVKQEATLTALREASRSQPHEKARWAIVNSRAKAGDATVVGECLPLLDPNHGDFDHALWALSALRTTEALGALREAFARFHAGERKDSIATICAVVFVPIPDEFVEHLEQRLQELCDKPCQQWTSEESRIVAVLAQLDDSTAISRFRELIARWRAEQERVELRQSVRLGIRDRTSRDDEGLQAAVETWLKLHG